MTFLQSAVSHVYQLLFVTLCVNILQDIHHIVSNPAHRQHQLQYGQSVYMLCHAVYSALHFLLLCNKMYSSFLNVVVSIECDVKLRT